MTSSYLRFDELDILEPGRWITILLGLEREFDVGDRVALIDGDDLAFAFASVRWTARMRADDVAYHDFDGYPTFWTSAEVLEHLRPYYPDRELEWDTPVDVIALRDFAVPDRPRPFDVDRPEVLSGP